MALGLLVVPVMFIIVIALFIKAIIYNKKKHSLISTIIHYGIFMGGSFFSTFIFMNGAYYFEEIFSILEILISAYMIIGFVLSTIWLIITIKKQRKLSSEVKEEMIIKNSYKNTKKEKQTNTNNDEITLKLNTKTLVIVGGGIMGFIIIILLIVLIFKGNGNSATHDRITLNDSNINDYITVQLSGRLTDYSNNYFKGVHLSGNITSSLNGSQCENVSFKLKMSVSHDDGWSYNGKGHDEFEERIFLDSGCNYAIATSKKLSSSAKSNSASYYYDISDVKGSIIVPKKIVE